MFLNYFKFTMAFCYTQGQKLVIELTNGQTFEGDCHKCAKNQITLTNIIEYPNGDKLDEILSYYRSEIASVRVLEQEHEQIEKPLPDDESQLLASKTIALLQDEYDRLKNMTTEYIYVEPLGSRFRQAMDHLKNCENIGVFAVISEGRSGSIKRMILLVLASWDQVYIFDLSLCSEEDFPWHLKLILESVQIQKVVHNSRALYDCLQHSYKVELNNIFDTYVADLKLQDMQTECQPKKPRSFVECFRHYLNFPNTFLEHVEDVKLKEWKKRPLDELYKLKAAQLAAYLITLKNKQEKILLKDYHHAVEVSAQTLISSDGFTAQKFLNSGDAVPEEVAKLL